MKRVGKHKMFWMAAAASVWIAGMHIPNAMAYFTTNVTAKGGYPLNLGTSTSIEEQVEDMTKHIVLSNTGESECYVRVKVFCGSQFAVRGTTEVDEKNQPYWEQNEGDGYWYYKDIVPVKGKTRELLAKIEIPKDQTESFNIVVIQECTPVLYAADGTGYADWSRKADTRTDIGTVTEEGADGE